MDQHHYGNADSEGASLLLPHSTDTIFEDQEQEWHASSWTWLWTRRINREHCPPKVQCGAKDSFGKTFQLKTPSSHAFTGPPLLLYSFGPILSPFKKYNHSGGRDLQREILVLHRIQRQLRERALEPGLGIGILALLLAGTWPWEGHLSSPWVHS